MEIPHTSTQLLLSKCCITHIGSDLEKTSISNKLLHATKISILDLSLEVSLFASVEFISRFFVQ